MDIHHQQQQKVADKYEETTSSIVSPASPPSASSSPSHEFSFTISLHSSSNPVPDNKTKTPPSNIAIDLSPADDIFFHGHLLPLHLLSHLPVSPRSSTNSLDSFTLPIKDLLDEPKPDRKITSGGSKSDSNIRTNISNNSSSHGGRDRVPSRHQSCNIEAKGRSKSKSFSLFSLPRWQKGRVEGRERDTEEKEQKHNKKKRRFDVLKRYVRMVRPLLFFRGRRENLHLRRQAYSFSGNLSLRNKQELRGRRGEYSAPASMRTSPTNSGLLVATTGFPSSAASDSTMEELQAAIQAAIAHCKNSIKGEDKLKC
ncbi:hypothetical protein COLO4_26483 [Corchorus olitorius]|uniref:BRI1 kinase inhibitor 1-like protein n=1 Tax=Corchorus olitorius TaxID=93759 RepID=A0A1R3HWV4_9ROSI|nr:hypothetical protein COLO4_26483 [Corchorus olitorius]